MWKHRVDMMMMLGPVMCFMFIVTSLGVKLIMGYTIVIERLDIATKLYNWCVFDPNGSRFN
jgi:hypothetical protein